MRKTTKMGIPQKGTFFVILAILLLNFGFLNSPETRSVTPTGFSTPELAPVISSDSPIQLNESDITTFLDETITTHMDENHVAGITVSVVKDGEVLFAKGYGYADLAEETPVTGNETLFGIASISKTFTATAVMQLVENGTLDLDEDINNYLESFRIPLMPDASPITLGHLLTHTAGFEESWEAIFYPSFEDLPYLDEFLGEYLPARVFPPGYIQSYSNLGSALVGLIIQEVTGTPFAQYVEDHILKPLGMNSTTAFQLSNGSLMTRHSEGYSYSSDRFILLPHFYCAVPPAGGMSSTAQDMAKFMLMFLNEGVYNNKRILTEESVLQMQAEHVKGHPSINGIGYGFYARTLNNQTFVGHTGGMPSFSSVLALLPKEECGIFISVNTDTGSYGEILTSFMDRYYPAPPIIAKEPLPTTPERLSLFEGYYLPTRRPYVDLDESMISICGSLITQIVVLEENSLLVRSNYLPIDGMSFVEVDDLVFHDKSGQTDIQIAFREEGSGNITFMFLSLSALTAMEKLHSWYLRVIGPKSLEFDEGETNHQILWSVSAADWQESTYSIHRNGSRVFTGNWSSSGTIVYDLNTLDVGIYNFTIVVEDVFNDIATHTVFVHVSSQSVDITSYTSSASLSVASSTTPSWTFPLFLFSVIIILPIRRSKRL